MAFTEEQLVKHVTLGGLQHFYENIKNIFLKKSEADEAYANIQGNAQRNFNASSVILNVGNSKLALSLDPANTETNPSPAMLCLKYNDDEATIAIPIKQDYYALDSDVTEVVTALENLQRDVNSKADKIVVSANNIAYSFVSNSIVSCFAGKLGIDDFTPQVGDIIYVSVDPLHGFTRTGFHIVTATTDEAQFPATSFICAPSRYSVYFNKADGSLYYFNNQNVLTKISFATQQTTGGNGETIDVATDEEINGIFNQLQNTQNEG